MYDYVIVGGGSAGCVIATRLSELNDVKVLLIEAGPTDKDPYIHMPVGFYKMTGGDLIWNYQSDATEQTKNRSIALAQGRVLGGGSSVNAQVFTRGCPEDYDRWAKQENSHGWSFKEIQPYFIKSEGNEVLAGEYHGTEGPLGVANLISPNIMTKIFVQACQQFGIPHTNDFNAANQAGCGIYQATQRAGRRSSAAVAYLNNAKQRSNLTVLTDCLTTRLLIENKRAIGVEYRHNGQLQSATAEREVIVTAGAVGSPKLLMLSGIGPAAELRSKGIDAIHDLAGVGTKLTRSF